jgi:hypothetical protein
MLRQAHHDGLRYLNNALSVTASLIVPSIAAA